GHLDTVWPKGSYLPTWSVSGDIAKGPGIFDMKAGFLQALYAVKEIPGADSKVAIIATTDEELGSQSSKALIERVSKSASAVLVLEASLNGKVKTGRKGTSMYQIALHGRASHAGLEPEKGINATTEIANIVLEVAKLANPEFGTTVVPTVMHSGTTTNTVPALATLDIDIRSFSAAELIRVDNAIKKLKATHPDAKIEITGGINRPPLETTSTSELYEILEKVASESGLEPVGQASVGGASDGNFAAAAGARVLDGLGAVGDGAHAPHEQILLSSIPSRVKLLTAFIKELIRD
ncbi:MAG: M20/M25/M40 family metallo-hydrolase, partial [Actinobacteria bacterium]|nr:M20/M25/M40 family metallo-hydrolase [Actinomycetota bacterium]